MNGRVIRNAATGERIVIRTSAADSDGALLAFDLLLPPGGHVPARHAHPRQHERFTIHAGELEFRIGRTVVHATAGSVVTIPPNTSHWFGNRGTLDALASVEVRPALRMEELLATSEHINRPGMSFAKRVLQTAVLLATFDRELALPRIVRLALAPLSRRQS
jgi:mannose-6-phosphate isomerase-like protein (cupin superfamily)